jgi:hypothetical protein
MFNSSLLKVSLRYGVVAGLLCAGFVISLYYMGKHPFLINPVMDFRIPIFGVMLFFCLKEVRDFHQGGVLYFWQGSAGSFFFLVAASIVAAGGIYTFGSWQPLLLAEYITEFTKQIQDLPAETVDRIGKSVVAENIKALPSTTMGSLAMLYAWQSIVIGFFISVIISVILRRQPKTE